MKFITQSIITACFLFVFTVATAQFKIANPSYKSRESSYMSLTGARISYNKLWLDMQYISYRDNAKFMIGPQTVLQIPGYSDESYSVEGLRNATTTLSPIPSNKYIDLAVGFDIPFGEMLEDEWDDKDAMLQFFKNGELYVDFVNCTSNFRSNNGFSYGDCFNFLGIKLKMEVEKWNALYCYNIFESLKKKGEFETTAQYQKRTSKDSIDKKVQLMMDLFEDDCRTAFILGIKDKTPQITYNADTEKFTIVYPGAEAVTIKVALDKAQAFKEDLISGKITLSNADVVRRENGKYVFDRLYFKKNSTETKYNNTSADAMTILLIKLETRDRIKKEFSYLQNGNGN